MAQIKITKDNYSQKIAALKTAKARNEFVAKHYEEVFGYKPVKVWVKTINGKLWFTDKRSAGLQAHKLGITYEEATGIAKAEPKAKAEKKVAKAKAEKKVSAGKDVLAKAKADYLAGKISANEFAAICVAMA